MAISAHFLISNSVVLVDMLPVSASFFGAIILGVASAFPELITSLIALLKKKTKISAGILIGSNITNPMFALGLGSMISGFSVTKSLVFFDLPFKILTGLIILIFLWNGKLNKKEAIFLISFYILYLVFREILFPVDIVL